MINKKEDIIDSRYEDGLDEGWWSSVLGDEPAEAPVPKEATAKPISFTGANLSEVDWPHAQELYDRDEVIVLIVTGYNRGGLLVQGEGIQGFVPISHLIDVPSGILEADRPNRLDAYEGKSLQLKVIECDPSMERIVLSERAALAGEGKRKQLFHSLRNGDVATGSVTNITDFGVFVDLGGVEGLIHVSELSWGRVQHPGDVLKIGDQITTLVLQVNEENSRVALSYKRLQPNPWDILTTRYQPGDVIQATITSITHFGAFARLNEGVEGLIHVSSINLPVGQHDLNNVLYPGTLVSVRILHIDADRRRLGLGLVSME
jgi:small subunit ribosomal protein S1